MTDVSYQIEKLEERAAGFKNAVSESETDGIVAYQLLAWMYRKNT